jgi:hypothetical protein
MARHPQHQRAVHRRASEHRNNEFIGACLEFDDLLAKLTALRADHFGVDPERERNWAEVGSVREGVRMLTEVVAFLTPAPLERRLV